MLDFARIKHSIILETMVERTDGVAIWIEIQ